MFRAPIFKHTPPPRTYLLIRHQTQTSTRYFIRDIPHLYLVGQLLPAMPIPRPTSRKTISTILKARLQIASYRLMRQDPLQRLRIDTLVRLFPDFTEQQIRQKVREFAVYTNGHWKLKSGTTLPTEEALRKLLGPESACLYEAMLVGQQRLRDAGISDDIEEEDNYQESQSIEAQLAPWKLTQNFIAAVQNKCMLALHGVGDPTKVKEGISMMRTSMKEVFLRDEETLEGRTGGDVRKNAKVNQTEQQQVYKEEITRIWNNQLTSLSNKEQLTFDEPVEEQDDQSDSLSDEKDFEMKESGKVLLIERMTRNEDGRMVSSKEAVTNPQVMKAYLHQRTLISQLSEEDYSDCEMTEEEYKQTQLQLKTKRHLETYTKVQRDATGAPSDTKINVSLNLKSSSAKQSSETPHKKKRRDDRRKKPVNPLIELSTYFLTAIQFLIDTPESQPFHKPVNSNIVKNYDRIITTPMSLEVVKAKATALGYVSVDAVLKDLGLIASNCATFNGIVHPLTRAIETLVVTARQKLYVNYDRIQVLQAEHSGEAVKYEEYEDVL